MAQKIVNSNNRPKNINPSSKAEATKTSAAKPAPKKPATAPAASPTPAATPPPTPAVTQEPSTPPVTGVANDNNGGTKVELQTSYLAFIAGLLAYYQPDDVFALASGNLTRDEVIAEFQSFVSAAEQTKASNQAWREDVQAERTIELQVRPLRANMTSIVKGRFGKKGTQLLKFGLAPLKTGVKTVAVKSAAVAKSKATRIARGTKGKVQKEAIKGNVTGVVITPVTAGASTPVTDAPAAAGTGAAGGANGAAAPAAATSPPAAGTPPHS